MFSRRSFISSASALAALVTPLSKAWAQAWPSRPIKFVVPLTPGGANDYLARLFSERLQSVLGQPVVVENKPGVGGNIGTEYVARQAADGYTLLISSNTHVINVNFFSKLPYDPIKDFEPVSMVGSIPFVMTVNAGTPVTTLKEFIAMAKAKPGTVTYGTAGIGTPHHLAAEQLKSLAGIDMTHVPYKGAAGIVPALLASEITVTIGAINSLLPHIRSGKLRPIAIAAANRTAILPDVPTMAEAGPFPGLSMDVWFAVLAPAGTPRAIIDRYNTEINKMLRDPQLVKDKLTPVGIEATGTTPERCMEILKADLAKYIKVAKDANIRPE